MRNAALLGGPGLDVIGGVFEENGVDSAGQADE